MCGGGFAGLLCEAFVPTRSVVERVGDLRDALFSRFPFSLASDLGGWFADDLGAAGDPVGAAVGWIPLMAVDLAPLFVVTRAAGLVVLGAAFLWFLIDRLTPQVTI